MRVALVEDHEDFRRLLGYELSRLGIEVVADVASAPEMVAAMESKRPEVVVIDQRLTSGADDEGLKLGRQLRSQHSGLGVMVISDFPLNVERALELFQDGSSGVGYLTKREVLADTRAFVELLAGLKRGESVVGERFINKLMARRQVSEKFESLTPRERDVLNAMVKGKTNHGIAGALGISEARVRNHITEIFSKIEVAEDAGESRRVHAVLQFVRLELERTRSGIENQVPDE
jgi:DNA-binding NarL/FixJ family response regulator